MTASGLIKPLIAAATMLAVGVTRAVAAPPGPAIAGQIVDYVPPVVVLHSSKRLTPSAYEPVYPGDIVVAVAKGSRAVVRLRRGEDRTVDRSSPRFTVPPAEPGAVFSLDDFARFIALFPTIFEPPGAPEAVGTTPSGIRTASGPPSPSLLSPLVVEQLAVPQRLVLPVAWSGGPAALVILDSNGSALTRAEPQEAGYGELSVPALDPGDYSLRIGEPKDGIVIRLVVTPSIPDASDPVSTLTLRAGEALKSNSGGRLQALADLKRLSDQSYVASALLGAVARGDIR